MKISIIIPVWGVENYILTCLQSVSSQQADCDIECLIVDDCGTDNSINIAKEFIRNYDGPIEFQIIERNGNGGLSAARNTGIRASSGDYLYFLDSDDELTVDAMSIFAKATKTMKCDFIIADYVASNAKLKYPHNELPGNTILHDSEVLTAYCNFQWYVMAWNKLLKRDFVINNNLYFKPGILHEDQLWSFRCALCADSVGIISDVCYDYKIRESSITESPDNARHRMESEVTIYCEICNEIKQRNLHLFKALHRFLRNNFFHIYHRHLPIMSEKDAAIIYRKMRRAFPYKWKDCLSKNSARIKGQYYDLHYAMPQPLDYRLFRYIISNYKF